MTEIGKNAQRISAAASTPTAAYRACPEAREDEALALEQPVAREARNDAPANDGDQQDGRGEREPPAESAGTAKPRDSRCISRSATMKRARGAVIGRLRQLRPVMISRAATARRATGKRQIGEDRQPRGKIRGNQAGDTPEQPEASERGERIAAHGQPSGPVRNRGQQKAGDRRHHETEQHFVHMPRQRIEAGWQLHIAEEHREPQRERETAQLPAARNIGRKA